MRRAAGVGLAALLTALSQGAFAGSPDPAEASSVPGMDVIPVALRLGRSPNDTVLLWNEGGTTHEVVLGSLAVLRGSGGDFTAAVEECLADDVITTSLIHADPPDPEDVFFLVRASGCGTYDSNGSGQIGSRDLEVDSSPAACPN